MTSHFDYSHRRFPGEDARDRARPVRVEVLNHDECHARVVGKQLEEASESVEPTGRRADGRDGDSRARRLSDRWIVASSVAHKRSSILRKWDCYRSRAGTSALWPCMGE